MEPSPCYGCTERTAACHGTCGRYKEWSTKHRAHKEHVHEAKFKGNMLRSLKRDGCEKQRRRHKR